MIQSILFFILGFLTAGFLALMIAPAIWRRAVALTRRRIEASVPLSLADIQADKDRMRAEFAMSTRRLEMSIKSLRERAAAQVVEINRSREELKRLAAERDERNHSIAELEARVGELREELGRREDQLGELAGQLDEAERLIEDRAREFEKMGRAYDEASFSASNRQIELVARESEVEKLAGDVQILRGQRKDAEQRIRDAAADAKAARDALKAERRKVAELETKLERMAPADHDDERSGNALLREQINDLAAEVVALTAKLEGPDSPINKALAASTENGQPHQAHEKIISLADRVRALQKPTSAG